MMRPVPPPHAAALLRVLRSPTSAIGLDDAEWDRLLRVARSARLHGVLAHRLQRAGVRHLPAAVAAQLVAAHAEAVHARQMLLYEIVDVRRVLAAAGVETMLLKGAAYVKLDLACAAGRLPSDLDILVRADQLDTAERRLEDAGWRGVELDEYDQRYYRRWVHQIPPMRAPGHVMELDLHHAILPPRGHMRVDTALLWEASMGSDGGVRIPAREDLVLHAIVHLFVDSDCSNRLRDLVDVGALIDQFCADDDRFVVRLEQRAQALGLGAAVAHAAAFLQGWLGMRLLSVPRASTRANVARALMERRLAPPHPDSMPPCVDVAHALLLGRALWLRLPWHLALWHAAHKGWRGSRAG